MRQGDGSRPLKKWRFFECTIKNIFYKKSVNPEIVTLKQLCDGLGISLPEFFNAPEFYNLEQEIK